MTTCESKLSMRLLIDTKADKVLFAETDKNCVDFLFHILSLSVGTAVSLLKEKEIKCGCLSNLYESVEDMNDMYIQSKDVLLKPKSPIEISSVPLQLLNMVLVRGKQHFLWMFQHLLRLAYAALPVMNQSAVAAATKGFVKDVVTDMVTDDLVVKPMSTISSIALLNKFNVKDVSALQEVEVNFGMEEQQSPPQPCSEVGKIPSKFIKLPLKFPQGIDMNLLVRIWISHICILAYSVFKLAVAVFEVGIEFLISRELDQEHYLQSCGIEEVL
ncbi:putative gibberellin-regulated protein 6-like [Capsicum annuum]|nr:putative gibberellin-regulated protein 6-like [Capsicum annuum]